ncbi:hypothetical protein OGAPHI_003265 [Ogataea philodendri]|uniref:Uncharacterized protein n=1 Tax=Ogataea philodendri TaxID=1378263 RepID=A0A9P8T6B9_9ASCO|nr:uncharacterized protein OGAPHI_003265 [Ogataea philodendri]KAH3666816.1 hypothetical protein OGAPHI_003265 [Ogataea philodendri]
MELWSFRIRLPMRALAASNWWSVDVIGVISCVMELYENLFDVGEAGAALSPGMGDMKSTTDGREECTDDDRDPLGEVAIELNALTLASWSLRILSSVYEVVNTLGSRQNLLATHEEVVRVRVVAVFRVWHRVERSDSQRELVQDVEVGVVLVAHQFTQQLLVLGGQVLVVVNVLSGVSQHLDTFLLLFVELRRLGQISRTFEVVDLENVGSTFRSSSNHLWSVSFHKLALDQELLEQLTDSGLQSENGLVCHGSQINHTSVQTGVQIDHRQSRSFSLGVGTRSVLDQQRQLRRSLRDQEDLGDRDLNVLNSGTLDKLVHLLNHTVHQHNRLQAQGSGPFDHLFGNRAAIGLYQTLDQLVLLSEREETHGGSLLSGVVHSGSEHHLLAVVFRGQGVEQNPWNSRLVVRLHQTQLAVVVLGGVVGSVGRSLGGLFLGDSGGGLNEFGSLLNVTFRFFKNRLHPVNKDSAFFAVAVFDGTPSNTITLSAMYVAMMKSCSTIKAVFLEWRINLLITLEQIIRCSESK